MGKKISWEDAEKLCSKKGNNDSIFAPENPYGYQINIQHPKIRPLYEHYKDRLGERILSDRQRLHFESIIFKMIERSSKEHEQGNTGGTSDGGS